MTYSHWPVSISICANTQKGTWPPLSKRWEPGAQVEAGAPQRAAVPIAATRQGWVWPVATVSSLLLTVSSSRPVACPFPPPLQTLPSRGLHSCPLAASLQAQLASWCLQMGLCSPLCVGQSSISFLEKVEPRWVRLGWGGAGRWSWLRVHPEVG